MRNLPENTLTKALLCSPSAFLIVNQLGTIQEVNKSLCETFMYERHELIGKSIEVLLPEQIRKLHQKHVDGYFQKARLSQDGRR